jgi:hypothetical protein
MQAKRMNDPLPAHKAQRADFVITDARPSTLARLDASIVKTAMSTAERVYRDAGASLPASPQFARRLCQT